MKISLSKLNFYSTVLTLVLIFVMYVIMTTYEYNRYNEMKQEEIRKEYIQKNKVLLQHEVNAEIRRIQNTIDSFHSSLVTKLQNRVEVLYEILSYHHQKLDAHSFGLLNTISAKVEDGYNYIFTDDGKILFHSGDKSLVGKNIFHDKSFPLPLRNFTKQALKNGESSGNYILQRDGKQRKVLTDVKKVLNFYLASSVYLDDLEKMLQESLYHSLLERKFGLDGKGYFWLIDTQNTMLLNPLAPQLMQKNLDSFKTPKGVQLFDKLQKILSTQDETFIQYDWPIPWQNKSGEKISFVKKVDRWGWILGAGFYFHALDQGLMAEEKNKKSFCIILYLKSV